jgi:hypothetical protein
MTPSMRRHLIKQVKTNLKQAVSFVILLGALIVRGATSGAAAPAN